MTEEIECYTPVVRTEVCDLRFEDFGGTGPAVDESYCGSSSGSYIVVKDLERVKVEEWHCSGIQEIRWMGSVVKREL
jgi:hypothetical protein